MVATGHADRLLNAIQRAGAMLDCVGTEEFGQHLFESLAEVVSLDHVAIFTFSESNGVLPIVMGGLLPTDVARSLSLAYVDRYHPLDPNRPLIDRADSGRQITLRFDPGRIESRRYWDFFFSSPRLIDKVSIIRRKDGACHYCNFYRKGSSGHFEEDERSGLEALAPLVIGSVHHHFDALTRHPGNSVDMSRRTTDGGWSDKAGLSEREKAVCERIVMGFSTEAIALDLGLKPTTVKTFRKRAYAKLGVSSMNELHRLYLIGQ